MATTTEGLIVEISGDVDKLLKALKQGDVGVEQFTKETNQALKKLNESLGGVQRPAANAGGAISGLNNIIRDAPFGIIGVGNNITQLIDAFQGLQKQTGSTTGALSTLISGVFSPAGIFTLGISAAISLSTVFSKEIGQLTSKIADLVSGSTVLSEAQKKYAEAVSESNKEAGKELVTLTQLRKQAENTALSQRDRLEAVKELQKEYPQFLGNLTNEQILTGNVGNAYANLTKRIIANARARAIENKASELQTQLLDLEIKQQEAFAKAVELRRQAIANQGKTSTRVANTQFGTTSTIDEGAQFAAAAQSALDDYRKALKNTAEVQQEFNKLLSFIPPDSLATGMKETAPSVAKVKEEARVLLSYIQGIGIGVAKLIPLTQKVVLPKLDTSSLPVIQQFTQAFLQQAAAAKAASDAMFAQSEIVATTLGPVLTDFFVNLSEGGNNAIEELVKQIGKLIVKLIAAAAAAFILSKLLNSVFPSIGTAGSFQTLFGGLSGLGSLVNSASTSSSVAGQGLQFSSPQAAGTSIFGTVQGRDLVLVAKRNGL